MSTRISRRQFLEGAALLAGATKALAAGQPLERPAPGYHGRFAELPVGSVKPRGWIQGWLRRQAGGLTGHPENIAYPYDTCMYAGKIPVPEIEHGETWWPYEQSGYFIDGAVRLNRLIDDPGIGKLAQANLKYILANSGPGKIGESVWGWPNTVVGRALLAEHSATGDPRIAQVLKDSVLGNRSFSWRNGYVYEAALYLYGLGGDPRLLEIARQGYVRYFVSDPKSFSAVGKIRGDKPLREHGVTAAEQLKLLPLLFCHTGDEEKLDLANAAYRKVEADSLMPDGGIVSSEFLGTTAFDSLHETCDITDWSWSFGYMLMASGDAHWADAIERMAFNALPGAVTKDFKQLQYFSSANQVLVSSTCCPNTVPTRMSYRAAHETECCSGNVNRAMPNYAVRMWMRMEGGLAATLFGPCEVSTNIGGQPVIITEETGYPFRDTISFQTKLAKPATFSLGLRIPEWCLAAEVTVNGKPSGMECHPGTFAILKREFRDGDIVGLRLPMSVQLREWFAGRAVSVQRGPLVYALRIDEKRVESQRDSDAVRRVLRGNDVLGFPAVEFFPAGQWRYGMDAAIKNTLGSFKVIESPLPDNPFEASAVPVRIEVPLRLLPRWEAAWKSTVAPEPADLNLAPHNPTSLPSEEEAQAAGESKTITLAPYGSTHLRLTTLPVIRA